MIEIRYLNLKNIGHVSNTKPCEIPRQEKLDIKTRILKTCVLCV